MNEIISQRPKSLYPPKLSYSQSVNPLSFEDKYTMDATNPSTPWTPVTDTQPQSSLWNKYGAGAVSALGSVAVSALDSLKKQETNPIMDEVYNGGGFFGLGQSNSIDKINNAFSDRINNTRASLANGFGDTNEALNSWKNMQFYDPLDVDTGLVGKGIGSILTFTPWLETRQNRGNVNADAASSAAKGALLGTMFMPGLGTAAGAILGDLSSKFRVFGTTARQRAYNRGVQKLNANNLNAYQNAVNEMEQRNMGNMFKNYAAEGGQLETNGTLWDSGLNLIGNGGTHEQNKFGGVQIGTDTNGIPNLVEEGETIWKDYVFSKRLKVPNNLKHQLGLKSDNLSFADASLKFTDEEHTNDPITKEYLNESLDRLRAAQEELKMKRLVKTMKNKNEDNVFAEGGQIPWMSIAGLGDAVIRSLKGPDYSNADALEKSIGTLRNISSSPISEYSHLLQYKPVDTSYYLNRLDAENAARRRMFNTFNPSSGALQLANDWQTSLNRGEILKAAEEQNLQQRLGLAETLSKLREFNAQQSLQASQTNAEIDAKRAAILSDVARLRESARLAHKQDINESMTSGIQTFADWLNDRRKLNAIRRNPALAQGVQSMGL